ncbi:MAG: efflux RND transporter periplasmic adaptor subunit [Gammaproteobacteria bacterium]
MNKSIILILTTLALVACDRPDQNAAGHGESGHDVEATSAEIFVKGPHGGKLFTNGDFALEMTIFESGVPPEFRVFLFRDGKPLPPDAAAVTITLGRLDGEKNVHNFKPTDDYLRGDQVVTEPHSFDVEIVASESGRTHRWAFASYEGRTVIEEAAADSAGMDFAQAGPATLRQRLALYGAIQPDPDRVRKVTARYPGLVRSVKRQVGDQVKAGETLATVESNESLQTYAVTSPIAGVITERAINVGETTGDAPLFVVADHSRVVAELSVFPRDRTQLRTGQSVHIKAADGAQAGSGKISALTAAPANTAGQMLVARIPLANGDHTWVPGQFITGHVVVGETKVPLAVANEGLQAFRDFTVVFAQVGNTYEVRMLELGRSDGVMTEVLGGIKPDTTYVTTNSYLIKADVEKSGASHDH